MASAFARPALQLIALTADKVNFHYAELHDNHLMRGSTRKVYTSNIKTVEMSAEWKTYLTDRAVEIEYGDSKWFKCKLLSKGLNNMLLHDSGYVIPMIRFKSAEVCRYFPRMAAAAPATMPAQTVRPPGIVAESASSKPKSKSKIIRRVHDDDADSAAEAVCNGDEDSAADDAKKERDALRVAVASMMSHSRPKSASKVSFK